MDPMEEQNHSVTNSEILRGAIHPFYQFLLYFAIYIPMYILLCMSFMIE